LRPYLWILFIQILFFGAYFFQELYSLEMSDKKSKAAKTPVRDLTNQLNASPTSAQSTSHKRYGEEEEEEEEVEQEIEEDLELDTLQRLKNFELDKCSVEELVHLVALKFTLDENIESIEAKYVQKYDEVYADQKTSKGKFLNKKSGYTSARVKTMARMDENLPNPIVSCIDVVDVMWKNFKDLNLEDFDVDNFSGSLQRSKVGKDGILKSSEDGIMQVIPVTQIPTLSSMVPKSNFVKFVEAVKTLEAVNATCSVNLWITSQKCKDEFFYEVFGAHIVKDRDTFDLNLINVNKFLTMALALIKKWKVPMGGSTNDAEIVRNKLKLSVNLAHDNGYRAILGVLSDFSSENIDLITNPGNANQKSLVDSVYEINLRGQVTSQTRALIRFLKK
jgi:hypothetical protein